MMGNAEVSVKYGGSMGESIPVFRPGVMCMYLCASPSQSFKSFALELVQVKRLIGEAEANVLDYELQ